MLDIRMKQKLTLLILTFTTLLLMSGCVNKHGVSLKYYSDCKEYYDLQGYYHKECGEDDIVTYKEMKDILKKKPEEPKTNVW
jgi:hypothetical protein